MTEGELKKIIKNTLYDLSPIRVTSEVLQVFRVDGCTVKQVKSCLCALIKDAKANGHWTEGFSVEYSPTRILKWIM